MHQPPGAGSCWQCLVLCTLDGRRCRAEPRGSFGSAGAAALAQSWGRVCLGVCRLAVWPNERPRQVQPRHRAAGSEAPHTRLHGRAPAARGAEVERRAALVLPLCRRRGLFRGQQRPARRDAAARGRRRGRRRGALHALRARPCVETETRRPLRGLPSAPQHAPGAASLSQPQPASASQPASRRWAGAADTWHVFYVGATRRASRGACRATAQGSRRAGAPRCTSGCWRSRRSQVEMHSIQVSTVLQYHIRCRR